MVIILSSLIFLPVVPGWHHCSRQFNLQFNSRHSYPVSSNKTYWTGSNVVQCQLFNILTGAKLNAIR